MLYLVETALVLLGAGCIASVLPARWSALDRVLAWFILIPTYITGLTLILGLAGGLTRVALVVANAVLAAAAIVLWRYRQRGRTVGVLAAVNRQSWRGLHTRLVSLLRPTLRQPWLWPLVICWLAMITWLVYVGLLVPPYGWDGLSYHIPPAVWWLQAGRIYPPPTHLPFGYGYPQGGSLLLLWQLAFTSGDHLVNLVQVPFAVLGVVAAYGLAREVGIGRPWAAWASCLWGLTPLILEQLTVPYNDVAFSALILAALYFTLRFWRTSREGLGHLWMVGLCVGLILGIKPNGFLVLGLMGLLALVPLCRPWRAYLRAMVLRALVIGLPALLLAGYWYIRNLVLYHNPLFPLEISLGGHTIFPGVYKSVASLISVTRNQTAWESFRLTLREVAPWYSYDTPNAGLGPVFTCVGIGAIVAAGLHACVRRRWRLVALLGASLLLVFGQPFKYPRYLLFLPAVAGICFAYLLQHIAGRWLRHGLQAVAVGLVLFTMVLVPSQAQLSAETIWQVKTAAAEGRDIFAGEFGLARPYDWVQRTPEFVHPDNRIAFTPFYLVYPLMGPGRVNAVYHIPPSPNFQYEEWVDQLLKERTTFLAVGEKNSAEYKWAKAHPERFIPWAEGQIYALYLINSDEARNRTLRERLQNGGAQP